MMGMDSASERRRYIVTSSLIGWAYTQNDTLTLLLLFVFDGNTLAPHKEILLAFLFCLSYIM